MDYIANIRQCGRRAIGFCHCRVCANFATANFSNPNALFPKLGKHNKKLFLPKPSIGIVNIFLKRDTFFESFSPLTEECHFRWSVSGYFDTLPSSLFFFALRSSGESSKSGRPTGWKFLERFFSGGLLFKGTFFCARCPDEIENTRSSFVVSNGDYFFLRSSISLSTRKNIWRKDGFVAWYLEK